MANLIVRFIILRVVKFVVVKFVIVKFVVVKFVIGVLRVLCVEFVSSRSSRKEHFS